MGLDCSKITSNSNTWIQYRNKGSKVTELQVILKKLGYYNSTIDGDFGPVTQKAVSAFQKATGNVDDSKVGPATCKSINEKITKLDANKEAVVGLDCKNIHLEKDKQNNAEEVKILQTHLKTLGYYTSINGKTLKIDGVFGTYTKQAVEKFQRATGNTPDGWVGSETCASLNQVIGATTTLQKQQAKKAEVKTETKKEDKNKALTIDASKYQFLPKGVEGNFHIDGIHFLSTSVEGTQGHGGGNWQYVELMGDRCLTYEGHRQPREYDVTCALRNEDYDKIKPALVIMVKKVCAISGIGLAPTNYVLNWNIGQPIKGWRELKFHLFEYYSGGA